MKIRVREDKTLAEIQMEFHRLFPFLKIEFYNTPHSKGEASRKENRLDASKTLRECRWIHQMGTLEYNPKSTVAELEQAFHEVFGLSVQVFRRSEDNWLQTTITDSWTLEEQNSEGMLACVTA